MAIESADQNLSEASTRSTSGPPTSASVSTTLAHERTDMAVNRNYMAGERTLMAWIRTALSMIAFGFTIGKLGSVLQEIEFKGILGNTRTVSIKDLAYFLVVLGTAAVLTAALEHWFRVRALNAKGLKQHFSISFIVALLVVATGAFALTSLVLSL